MEGLNSEINHTRYQRQILLKEFGKAGQQKLQEAKILVIGAGGLGCPALQYLAAAGIGKIGIVDFDVVELHNLQRQILYTVEDIGKSKAETAAKKLKALNPDICIDVFNLKITNANALNMIQNYDLVVDGSDNFVTRYLVNDACVILDKPLVYGAVLRFEGQVGVFNLEDKYTHLKLNYRDLFPDSQEAAMALSCNEVGVLGVIPGIIGSMQAAEAIKIISGIGKPLSNKILTYNALTNSFYDIEISASDRDNTLYPKNAETFLNFDYDLHCASANTSNEITMEEFEKLRIANNSTFLDVRETEELPLVTEFKHLHIPLSRLKEELKNISLDKKLIIFCNSGQRSLQAVSLLRESLSSKEIYSLAGGIISWKNKFEKIKR